MKRAMLVWVLACGICVVGQGAFAGLHVASPFTDNMVLQQGIPVPVWGTATPGEHVDVQFDGQTASSVADTNGTWHAAFQKLKAEPTQVPRNMVITGKGATGNVEKVTFANVLVGEVWICSGQSNMELPVPAVNNSSQEMASADFPAIRMFTVNHATAARPQSSCSGNWVVCSPQTVGSFSAVGYFFARELHQKLGVPVGMLHTSWGGSPIEPWTSLDGLRTTTAACQRVEFFEKVRADYEANPDAFIKNLDVLAQKQAADLAQWLATLQTNDIGTREQWATAAMDTNSWKETPIPTPVSFYGGFTWCRVDVEIPSNWLGRSLSLNLGSVDEMDTTFINGTPVGETMDPSQWKTPRHYKIPGTLTTNAHLTIAVRVMNLVGASGMGGHPTDFSVIPDPPAPGETPVMIATGWHIAIGSPIDVSKRPSTYIPTVAGNSWDVSTIYNAMVAPLVPYGVRGAIWYQGEANADQAREYAELFPAMIRSWREAWGQKEFPFLFVQLAGFMARQTSPVEPSSWANVRDSQRITLSVPDTGMAVASDIGDAGNIHPTNKQDVGHRLALWALARTYGTSEMYYSGPLYRDMQINGNRAVVNFDQGGGGLVAHGSPLTGFAIAGSNKVFHVAKAVITGDSTVLVSSDKVPVPAAVRYAWANNPIANLYNGKGLPASSFRTDTWPAEQVTSATGEKVVEPVADVVVKVGNDSKL